LVKIVGILSNFFIHENGILQDSNISVTLFLIAINDIKPTIKKPVQFIQFTNDINIMFRSKNKNSTTLPTKHK
jgi:hypothetical protein